MAWAAGEPFVEVLPWPDRAPFAAHIESDREGGEAQPAALAAARSAREARSIIAAQVALAERSARLFRLALPPDLLAQPQRSWILAAAERELGSRGAWLAPRGEIARWKRLRAGLAATLTRAGPHRGLLEVTNRNREELRGAVLRVHLNTPLEAVEIGRTTLQQEPALAHFEPSAQRVDVVLPEIPGGASRSYTLDLKPAADART
jgi:hypothetical protein